MNSEAKNLGVSSLRAPYVDISGRNLSSIPEFVFRMPNLTRLDLSDNVLTSLPEKMGTLKNLQYLTINRNNLGSLPESIGKLTDLKGLSLTNNKLTALPESIGKLTKLSELYLGSNKLSTLPKSIGNLKNLIHIFLNDNRLTTLPESMKDLDRNIDIVYNDKVFNLLGFFKEFEKRRPVRNRPVRVTDGTNIFNGSIMEARLSNVPMNKRAFINNKSNVTNNGTLRRIYNVNGLQGYMRGKTSGRLHGGKFTPNKITLLKNVPFTVNKSAYLRNIKDRLVNTSVNNMSGTIKALKNTLPMNVNKNDVNRLAKNVARNKVRNTAANSRNRVINALRAKGLLTNEDIKKFRN